MSVIAKLYIHDTRQYGSGALTMLNCVADNDVMAAYAESDEDKLFTRYSPSGDVKLHHEAGGVPLGEPGDKFYFIIVRDDEVGEKPEFPGAVAFRSLQVYGVTDFGHDAKKIEMRDASKYDGSEWRGQKVNKFSWYMTIDNPPLMDSGFLKPGASNFWLAIYSAGFGQFATAKDAIAAAHSA